MNKKIAAAIIVATGIVLAGCTGSPDRPVVGVSLPSSEAHQRAAQALVESLDKAGYDVRVDYADGDDEAQLGHVDALIKAEVEALVIGPVKPTNWAAVAQQAEDEGIPVIAYESVLRDTDHADLVVAHDPAEIGKKQAWSLLNGLGLTELDGTPRVGAPAGPFAIELFAGPANDARSALMWNGAMQVLVPFLTDGTLRVASGQSGFDQAQTANWDADAAQKRMSAILAEGQVPDAVLTASDALAGAVIAAHKDAKVKDSSWPIITGSGAELAAVQAIHAGTQHATEFADPRELGLATAKAVTALLNGDELETVESAQFHSDTDVVPAHIVSTQTVVADNLEKTVIGTGYWSADEVKG